MAYAPGLVAAGNRSGSEAAKPAGVSSGWDALIGADGQGLPAGSGTSADGRILYREKCERCHGPEGRGATAEELVGGIGSLGTAYPDRTIGSYWPYASPLYDYLRRAMPADAPLSLSDDDVYALTAYLLHRNGLIGEQSVVDATSLARMQMPNRGGFHTHWDTADGD